MIDLYGSPTPNVMKITIMLEEVGLPYDLKPVNVWKGEQFRDAFVRLNPNSKVPVIVDHDNPEGPFAVFESGAILVYLAEKAAKFLPASGNARSNVFQWLMFQVASIGPMSGQFNHFDRFAGEGHDYAKSRYTTELKRLHGVLDRRLAEAEFLGGDYSIADMAVYPWIMVQSKRLKDAIPFMDAHSPLHPNLARWFDACAARPGVERGSQSFGTLKSGLPNADADDFDRIFGRGKYAYQPG